MTSLELDAVVIGGGVVGLAAARALLLAGRAVTVLEAEPALGAHSSSRNSEVIHAGIYYEPGSLKARSCVSGRHALYDYCERHEVAHERLGKIIVATRDEEIPALESLKARAESNNVHDLVWLDRAEISALEPRVSAVRGLLSPSTGIVDSHALMSSFRRDIERGGSDVVLRTPVLGGRVVGRGIELTLGHGDPVTAVCRTVINAAGLRAQEVARSLVGVPSASIPGQYFSKGHYFVLNGRSPFRRLVYPLPVPGGLGVHVTLDLAKQARFGPDVSPISGVDYSFDEQRSAEFYKAIRSYFPSLEDGSLQPGYTGIRPKLNAGGATQDFIVQGPSSHGVPQLVNLYGIESPGLTASLALADCVLEALA
ncbi:MAG TPA: NAD(P)/FAD-dependent oxidoreductase [Polyangiaceae bacterium]|jgi:L-2-hydroxyglutarate oxidase LhgO|nr:NAD(P)/FAD-dependent oxidoreductase [Polyangiaceae bacterium]